MSDPNTLTVTAVVFSDEYWEARHHDLQGQVAAWLTGYYGERCPDYEPGCECCERWKLYDALFSEPGELP